MKRAGPSKAAPDAPLYRDETFKRDAEAVVASVTALLETVASAIITRDRGPGGHIHQVLDDLRDLSRSIDQEYRRADFGAAKSQKTLGRDAHFPNDASALVDAALLALQTLETPMKLADRGPAVAHVRVLAGLRRLQAAIKTDYDTGAVSKKR